MSEPTTWLDDEDDSEEQSFWLDEDDDSGPDGRPDPFVNRPRWGDLRADQAADQGEESEQADGAHSGTVTYEQAEPYRGQVIEGEVGEDAPPENGGRASAPDHGPEARVQAYGWSDADPRYAGVSADGAQRRTAPEPAPSETAPPTPHQGVHADGAHPAPSGKAAPSEISAPPPPSTPHGSASRNGEGVWGQGLVVRERASRLWASGPGKLQPVAWWVARTVWRRPLLWGAVLTLVVLTTAVRLDHIAIALTALAALAVGPVAPGATNRRDRFVSLRSISAYRKYRRRIKGRWGGMWANAGLVRSALSPGGSKRLPKLVALRPHRDGVTAYVAGEKVAVGIDEVLGSARALTETAGALSLRVTKPSGAGSPKTTPTLPGQLSPGRVPWRERGHLLAITFKFQDPFPKRPITLAELPAPSKRGAVVIGLDEEHRALEKSLFLPSLIVGAPGSGKSTEVWTTLEALLTAGIPFRLRVFDPKGGLELGDLKDAAYAYESVPSRWPRFLEQACEALRVRQEIMAKMTVKDGVRVRKIAEPTEEFPLDLMLIDELVTVLAMSRGQEARVRVFGQEMSAKEAFVVYLSQIRASLGSCIALSQLGEKSVLGPARGMFPYMSCLRVGPTEKELVDILLGQGAHNAFPAHLLDPTDPNMAGRGWVRTKGGIIGYRAAFMDDAARANTAKRIGEETARFRRAGQRDPEVAERARAPRKRAATRAATATPAAKAARTEAGTGTTTPTKRAPAKKAAPRKKTSEEGA